MFYDYFMFYKIGDRWHCQNGEKILMISRKRNRSKHNGMVGEGTDLTFEKLHLLTFKLSVQ